MLGIEPGDEVTSWRDGDHVAVRPMRSTQPLKGRFAIEMGRMGQHTLEQDHYLYVPDDELEKRQG